MFNKPMAQETLEKIVNTMAAGLILEDYSVNHSRLTVYISVPKDGEKVIKDMPAVYGAELVKRFRQALCDMKDEYSFDVKFKIRDEYWTIEDARIMLGLVKARVNENKTQFSKYNSL